MQNELIAKIPAVAVPKCTNRIAHLLNHSFEDNDFDPEVSLWYRHFDPGKALIRPSCGWIQAARARRTRAHTRPFFLVFVRALTRWWGSPRCALTNTLERLVSNLQCPTSKP
jgi:hypothetical protein